MARRQSPFERAQAIQAFRSNGGSQGGWAQRRDQLLTAGVDAQGNPIAPPSATTQPVIDPNAIAAGMKMQADREAQEQYWRSLRASMQTPGPLVAPPVPTAPVSAAAPPLAAAAPTAAPVTSVPEGAYNPISGWGAEPTSPTPPPPAPVPTAAPPVAVAAPAPVIAPPAPIAPAASPVAVAGGIPTPGDPGWAAYVASIGGSAPAYIKPPWQIEYEQTGQLPSAAPAAPQLPAQTFNPANPSPGMDLNAMRALSAQLDAAGPNYDQTNNSLRSIASMRDQPWLYADVLSKYKPEELQALGIAPGAWNQTPPPPDPTTGAPRGLGMANRNGPSTTAGPSMLPAQPPAPIASPTLGAPPRPTPSTLPPAPPAPISPNLGAGPQATPATLPAPPPPPIQTGTVGNSPTNPTGGVNPVVPAAPAPPPPSGSPYTALPRPSDSAKLAGAIQDAIKPPTPTPPPGTTTTRTVPTTATSPYAQPAPSQINQPDTSQLATAIRAQSARKIAQQNGITSGTTTAGTAY